MKDALRRDAAIHLLLNPELTLEDVAQQVGFSETSTFHRAFKNGLALLQVYIASSMVTINS